MVNGSDVSNWLKVNAKDVGIIIALSGVIWWASRLDDRVQQVEMRGSNQIPAITSRLDIIQTNQQDVLRRLNSIESELRSHMNVRERTPVDNSPR